MITKNEQVGDHKEVTVLEFGTGDIMFSRLIYDNGAVGLAFSTMPARKIGDETTEFGGGGIESVPNVQVIATFSHPASITALIHSLIEIQKTMFDKLEPLKEKP